jgi:phage tail sheath protein FI
MPVAPTYPGVYVEEVPSGVRTITGVATSITAFIGRALRGPVNEPLTVNGFADFERLFGGLWAGSRMGYAVRDFFRNGGAQAIVVRLFNPEEGNNAPASKAKLKAGNAALVAAYEGSWGKGLRATVDTDVFEEAATALGLAKADLFNLTITDTGPAGTSERFLNLSFKESARRVDRVLGAQSRLVRWDGDFPEQAPAVTDESDAITTAEEDLKAKKKALVDAIATSDQAAIDAAQQSVDQAKLALDAAINALVASDGSALTYAKDFAPPNGQQDKKGLYALERVDLFNLLCIPPYQATDGVPDQDVETALVADSAAYCEARRAMLIVDPPSKWTDKTIAKTKFTDPNDDAIGTRSKNAALFFPRLQQPDPLRDGQVQSFVPCGAVAGVFARTDTQRGVWKAPAGLDATLVGVPRLSVPLTDQENGELNPLGINVLRAMPAIGRVVWGSRTLQGDDRLASEWKYIPVRRLALYIEESLYRGTQWVVFEPNDEPLWAQIRLNVGAFMHNLFRQGAFQGTTPRDAYFVKCDKETTTQNDINLGVVNIMVGFAPLKPAEFVIIKIQQMAGQIET